MTFILGGARSGKSTYAQNLLAAEGGQVLFVATAQAGDEEMKERIALHRASRPAGWLTLEAPLYVGEQIAQAPATPYVLIDCLTLLASNVLMAQPEPVDEAVYTAQVMQELDALLTAYEAHAGQWLIISNEVGLGLVPPYPLGRFYRDALGKANQRLAAYADQVILMVAGLPLIVKG